MLKGMPFLFIDDNEGIFMVEVEEIKKYPGADARQMGDSPELANELADPDQKGIKTASCGSFCLLPAGKICPEDRELSHYS